MTAYLGEFTVRNNGADLPARIYVGTADMMSSQEPSPLVLSSDPVVMTWDECSLTDVIHRSQLQLNLVARSDGDYRDIMNSLDQIYCRLDIDPGAGYTTWWCGAYASSTWMEPFSREKGYAVQLTFSDFGFLERLDYDGSRFGCTGGVSVASVVSWLASLFTGYVYMPAIEWIPMTSAMMNGNEFSTLLVRDALFTEDDGTPRNMLDILTDILEPACVHIMQYCGKVYLFRPDGETAGEIGADVSSTLKAAGTDAEMESCETYSRAELDFDPAASTQESEVKPDDTPFMYDGYAPLPLSSAGQDVIMTHDDNPSTCRAIVYGSAVEGPLMVLLVKSAFFSWEWHGTPPAAPSTTTSFILYNPGKVRIAVSPDTITPDILKEEHIVSSVLLTLDLWMFMQNPEGRRLGGVRVDSEIRFISMTGDISYLWDDMDWHSAAPSELHRPQLSAGGDTSDNYGTFSLTAVINKIPGTGTIEAGVLLSTLYMWDVDGDGQNAGAATADIMALGFCGMRFEHQRGIGMVFDYSQHLDRELSATASDKFTKSFRLGTSAYTGIDAVNCFIDPDGGTSEETGKTLLDHYADFLEQNFKVTASSPVRRRVRGSYFYSHMDGLPVFSAGYAVPLLTLQRSDRTFFLMSEQWRLRSGVAEVVLEEAYAVPPAPALVRFRETLISAADGTAANFIAMTSGVDSIAVAGSMLGTCDIYGSASTSDDYLDADDPSWAEATQVGPDAWTVLSGVRHIKISVNYMSGMPSPLTGTFNFFKSGRPAESHRLTVERSAASRRYQMRVTSAGSNKTQVIRTVSEMAGMGMVEAKEVVENGEWFGSFTDYEASDLQSALQDLGATVETREIS